jgi:hypothetical protein
MMKVKDLIDELKELDQEAEIYVQRIDEDGNEWMDESYIAQNIEVQQDGSKEIFYSFN